MTRRALHLILGVGLCAMALPGCAWLSGHTRDSSQDHYVVAEDKSAPRVVAKEIKQPVPAHLADHEESEQRSIEASFPKLPRVSDQNQTEVPPGQRLPEFQNPPLAMQPPPATNLAPLSAVCPPSLQQIGGVGPPLVPIAELSTEKTEPLVGALRQLLNNNPQEALKYLRSFDGSKKDMFMGLLAALAVLNEKSVDQLTADERLALEKQLQGLELVLRNPADLVIAKMCLCERIDGYGQYKPLPEGHLFQAPQSEQQIGERVQVYVDLRNITSQPRDSGYITALKGTIKITRADGFTFYEGACRDREMPLPSSVVHSDWFWCCDFFVPHLIPPGKHTLTIEITDSLHQPPRVARKSVEFVVAPTASH